jgi:hypothetical protein
LKITLAASRREPVGSNKLVVHRIEGITESDIIEVSMPESGTTWQLKDDYAPPDEAPEERQLERGE